jgi:uncharacterized protein (TIGR03663 family)
LTIKSESVVRRVSLDTPLTTLFILNWELVLYTTFFVIAVFTHLYHLGTRVMSHDESLHTLYSWNLYAGKGYQHDPLMHGPTLFHFTALMYFLFGDNDFTARLAAALFGIVLVILPYWFRPWLGRLGALSASFMLLISPGILYYTRYIRHEPFMLVWIVLMTMAFFQFMRTRNTRWLFVGALSVALMRATMEVSYIAGFIGVTFILAAFVWEILPRARRQTLNYSLLGIIFVLLGAVTYMAFQADELSAASGGQEGGFDPWHYIDLMIMISGLLIGFWVIQMGIDYANRPVILFLKTLQNRLLDVGKAALAAVIVFTLFYTTFFSNIGGLYSGTIGDISYWLAQHEVQRGGQPWYYYLFLVPLYEFLPASIGIIGGLVYIIRRNFPAYGDSAITQPGRAPHTLSAPPEANVYWPSDGGTFVAYLLYWTITSFFIFSWAGEKMPWLTVYMTLPLIFLAAHVIQTVLGNFNWSEARQKGSFLLGGVLLLVPAALVAVVTAQPFQSQSLQSINETLQFLTGLIILLALLGIVGYFIKQMGMALAARVAFITAFVLMSLLTIRFAWLLNYVNYDYVNEILVYAHASPDVKLALDQIDEISRRTAGDKMIRVAYDNDSTWPLEWYMREYPNRVYYGENPTREALDVPVVIVGSANEGKVKPYLGDKYTRFNYRLVWWPMEDYKAQTPGKLWENYVVGPPAPAELAGTEEGEAARRTTVRDNWRKLLNIIFYRHYEDYDLNEWPFVHRFNVYIRNDNHTEVWGYHCGCRH